MMPCLHYDCSNRNSFGYCKTTVCINEHYQQEQWSSPSTTNKSESVVIKQQTNADRIRAMSDEELAKFIERTMFMVYESVAKVCRMVGYAGQWDSEGIIREELEWLKQEVDT